MPKNMDVGRSWRTYAKHELMRQVIGQEIGATRFMPEAHRLVWPDLTAGDAAPIHGEKWHQSCSPGILAHHAAGSPKPVLITLHEIQPNTYDRLLGNLAQHLPTFGYVRDGEECWRIDDRVVICTRNISGQQASVDYLLPTDAVFVLNDPNAITEWAMRDTFAQEIADRTWLSRSLSTMGCNPAGIKRLPIEERIDWFDLINSQQAALPRYRDLLLTAIERDEAQWAYLLGTSEKWRSKTEAVTKTAFKKSGRTVAMTWFRQDNDAFEEAKLQLFLTKSERKQLGSTEAHWSASSKAERLRLLSQKDQTQEPKATEWTLFDEVADENDEDAA